MKYGVTKNTLLITAGIVWLLAGINILRIGISCWINDSHYWFFKVCEATIVFLLFFGLIFHKLYKKHTHRISQKKAKNCPFSFFDVKGWIIMAFMITIGILTRTLHLRLSGNFWLVSFKISYLCLPLFYETRTTPSCHPSGCAYRQL